MGNCSSKRRGEIIDLETFESKSRQIQEHYRSFLGENLWNVFLIPEQERLLWSLIAVALFGEPREDRDDFGFNNQEKATIADIIKKCKKTSVDEYKVSIAVIYVTVWIDKSNILITPVFRVKAIADSEEFETNKYKVSKNPFIDFKGRVYSSWENYKKENTWNGCFITTPTGCFYSLKNELAYELSDQTDRGYNSVVIGSLLGATSVATMLAPIPPAAATVSAAFYAASSTYNAWRNISELFDRYKHQQSVLDRESIVNWVGAGFSMMGLVGSGMKLYQDVLLQSFTQKSQLYQRMYDILTGNLEQTNAISENTIMILNRFLAMTHLGYVLTGVYEIGNSELEKRKVSGLDIRRMRALFLYLHGIDINAKTIKDVSENISRGITADKLRQYLLASETSSMSWKEKGKDVQQGFRIGINRNVMEIGSAEAFFKWLWNGSM